MGQNTKQRRRLFRENPHCFWCKRLTVWEVFNGPDRLIFDPLAATVDHVYSKYDPRRSSYGKPKDVVLACYECNQRRGRDDEKEFLRRKMAGELTYADAQVSNEPLVATVEEIIENYSDLRIMKGHIMEEYEHAIEESLKDPVVNAAMESTKARLCELKWVTGPTSMNAEFDGHEIDIIDKIFDCPNRFLS